MSKKDLKEYLHSLKRAHIENQILDLYERFVSVKEFYEFVFNPDEQTRIEDAKAKIGLEYFPRGRRRKAKLRRSVAQKYIRHFQKLGVQPTLVADLMLFNIETAQTYRQEKHIASISFYNSMHRSLSEAVKYCIEHGLLEVNFQRIHRIVELALSQRWPNANAFTAVLERLMKPLE